MISDNKYIEHESLYEKLLGYKYSTKTDVFKLSGIVFDKDAKTKRGILCQTSKLFDPLGLVTKSSGHKIFHGIKMSWKNI